MLFRGQEVNNLYQLKKACGKTFQELADSLGITRQAVYLHFKNPDWNFKRKQRYKDAFGCGIGIIDRVVKMQIESEGTK